MFPYSCTGSSWIRICIQIAAMDPDPGVAIELKFFKKAQLYRYRK
jgi:hypothetical protein